MTEITEIRLNEYGDETHESWLLVGANHVSSSPGARLFDSEIQHQHYVKVTVRRCTRKRDLHHDWLHATEQLVEFSMSEAQWGAFVSSFGRGDGVPATLDYLGRTRVPSAPVDSRLDQSHKEVKGEAAKSVAEVQRRFAKVMEVFEGGGGKKAMREALRDLDIGMQHVPSNMEFAAKSMTEHVENVMTKARADFEAMVLDAARQGALDPATIDRFQLGMGDSDVAVSS